ncbi:MAG TPA: hypothetical protein VGN16_08250 [Acidobacteriaceae bacterium]|jgi:hypothetical protein
MAATQPHDKYYLRSLHEDIALLDRKLAHMAKYETFPTDKERDAATGKLNTKRALLVRNALKLAEEGVEFKPTDLPRSLRSDTAEPAEVLEAAAQEATEAASAHPLETPAVGAYDGSVLNFRTGMKEYMEKRRKTLASAEA